MHPLVFVDTCDIRFPYRISEIQDEAKAVLEKVQKKMKKLLQTSFGP